MNEEMVMTESMEDTPVVPVMTEEEEAARAVQLLDEEEYDESYSVPEVSNDSSNPVDNVVSQQDGSVPEVKEESLAEDVLDYEGNYTNGIARALDNIGSVFKNSAIGDVFHRLAEAVEDKFGTQKSNDEITADVRDELTNEIQTRDGSARITEATVAASDAMNVDSTAFVNDLNKSAMALSNGDDPANTLTGDLAAAVEKEAGTSPVETGDAMQLFNDAALSHIDNVYEAGSKEHTQAVENLSTVMSSMTNTYYTKALQDESDGMVLSETDKQKVDSLNVVGVSVPYSEFVPGVDVSVPQGADAAEVSALEHKEIVDDGLQKSEITVQEKDGKERLRKSDGSLFEGLSDAETQSVRDMEGTARYIAATDGFVRSANKTSKYDYDHLDITMRQKVRDIRQETHVNGMKHGVGSAETLHQTGESYVSMMRGLQAYNDAAVDSIRTQYANDPRGMQQATKGLSNIMRKAVGDGFDAIQNDDGALKCLNEEQRAELDSMRFTGVNVKYSDYKDGMDLKTGEITDFRVLERQRMSVEEMANPDQGYSPEEKMLYADLVSPQGSWSVTKPGQAVNDGSSVFVEDEQEVKFDQAGPVRNNRGITQTREDRLAMAENAFGAALNNDHKAQKNKGVALGFGE